MGSSVRKIWFCEGELITAEGGVRSTVTWPVAEAAPKPLAGSVPWNWYVYTPSRTTTPLPSLPSHDCEIFWPLLPVKVLTAAFELFLIVSVQVTGKVAVAVSVAVSKTPSPLGENGSGQSEGEVHPRSRTVTTMLAVCPVDEGAVTRTL